MKKVIVITGPTCVGKTALSIKIAHYFNAEIINADQSQMHKDLNIGTAKITKDEMDGINHYFVDNLKATERFSIRDYQVNARKVIDNMQSIPLIVGGSGLYINALIKNYDLSSKPRDINKYKNLSDLELYDKLLLLDCELAKNVHYNNRKRVERYLELLEDNKTITKEVDDTYYDALQICLIKPRDILYNDINSRCLEMIKNGWIDEIIKLKEDGVRIEDISEIGYKELNEVIENTSSLEEAILTIQQKTRRYAKRQMTWFRNKMNCIFINNDEDAFIKIRNLIMSFIQERE